MLNSDLGDLSDTYGSPEHMYTSIDFDITAQETFPSMEPLTGEDGPSSIRQEQQESGLYSAETIYSMSETSSLSEQPDEGYITDLATDLASTVGSCSRETLGRIAKMLPGLLRNSLLRLGSRRRMLWIVISHIWFMEIERGFR